ncbi:MAG: LPXTG cell wall anchor domain-containing protein [Ruminococcus sp.]|nr:LPXTG cell wall anchor domain-containing protein [Ruminococcus sp.]
MKDYASLRKKRTTRTIGILLVVLLIIEVCSLTVLFSRVANYTTGGNYYQISLTEGGDMSKLVVLDAAQSGFIEPDRVADPETEFFEDGDVYNDYDFGYLATDENGVEYNDNEVINWTSSSVWTTDTDVEIFHLSYNETGEVTVKSENEDKVFAPGTGDIYDFSLMNNGDQSLKYLVYLESWAGDENDPTIPLTANFYGGNVSATEKANWEHILNLTGKGDLGGLAPGAKTDYHIGWEWPFEYGNGDTDLSSADAYDTMLGNLAAFEKDLFITVRIKTVAWIDLEPTEPSTEVTEPPTEVTEPPTEVTEPPTEVTEPPTEVTEPPTEVTEPPTEVTEPPTEPTEPAVDYWYVYTSTEGEGTADATPDKVEQTSDDTFTLHAEPAEGWKFDHWEIEDGDSYDIISGSLTDPDLELLPYSDIHAKAVFVPDSTDAEDYWYIYADVKDGEGTATRDPERVPQDSDDTATLVATPADGYEFVGWEFDDGDVYDILDGGKLTDATLKIKPGSDIHAHAIFKPKATQPATAAPASEPATSAPATTPSTTPKTGDTTHMLLWLIISGLAFIGLVALVVVYIRLRKKES